MKKIEPVFKWLLIPGNANKLKLVLWIYAWWFSCLTGAIAGSALFNNTEYAFIGLLGMIAGIIIQGIYNVPDTIATGLICLGILTMQIYLLYKYYTK